MNRIRESFTLSDNAEITLELNPGTIGEEKVKIYEKAGINRFSVGLQTAIDSQLEDIGRIHNVHDYVYATKLLKGKNFSTDVMLGLKNQTKADIKKTIELAAACGSSHISMYALTVEDGTPIYTDYLNGELPDSDEVADMYDYGRNLLEALGYRRLRNFEFRKTGIRKPPQPELLAARRIYRRRACLFFVYERQTFHEYVQPRRLYEMRDFRLLPRGRLRGGKRSGREIRKGDAWRCVPPRGFRLRNTKKNFLRRSKMIFPRRLRKRANISIFLRTARA